MESLTDGVTLEIVQVSTDSTDGALRVTATFRGAVPRSLLDKCSAREIAEFTESVRKELSRKMRIVLGNRIHLLATTAAEKDYEEKVKRAEELLMENTRLKLELASLK